MESKYLLETNAKYMLFPSYNCYYNTLLYFQVFAC